MKNIMKKAWEMSAVAVIKFGGNKKEYFATALKMAWAELKQDNKEKFVFIGVKSWFNFENDSIAYAINNSFECEFVKETEKAVNFKFHTQNGTISQWFPKSALITVEDVKKEQERSQVELNRNEMLLNFAKENNVKGVRKFMKTKTLINKIIEAGLEIPA